MLRLVGKLNAIEARSSHDHVQAAGSGVALDLLIVGGCLLVQVYRLVTGGIEKESRVLVLDIPDGLVV
jgi:hypothetical protein